MGRPEQTNKQAWAQLSRQHVAATILLSKILLYWGFDRLTLRINRAFSHFVLYNIAHIFRNGLIFGVVIRRE